MSGASAGSQNVVRVVGHVVLQDTTTVSVRVGTTQDNRAVVVIRDLVQCALLNSDRQARIALAEDGSTLLARSRCGAQPEGIHVPRWWLRTHVAATRARALAPCRRRATWRSGVAPRACNVRTRHVRAGRDRTDQPESGLKLLAAQEKISFLDWNWKWWFWDGTRKRPGATVRCVPAASRVMS